MTKMTRIHIGTYILIILNDQFINAEPSFRTKRYIKYSRNVSNYYSNFNQPDIAISTVLPSLDSDGSSNAANYVHNGDAPVLHWMNGGIHYFRCSTDNKIKKFSNPVSEVKREVSWYSDDKPDSFLDIPGEKFFSFYPLRLYPKRAPSGFLGLRGKKYNYNDVKRIPSGFTGMRGKKSEHKEGNNIHISPGDLELIIDSNVYELLQRKRRIHENTFHDNEIRKLPEFLHGKKVANAQNAYTGAKRAPSEFLDITYDE